MTQMAPRDREYMAKLLKCTAADLVDPTPEKATAILSAHDREIDRRNNLDGLASTIIGTVFAVALLVFAASLCVLFLMRTSALNHAGSAHSGAPVAVVSKSGGR